MATIEERVSHLEADVENLKGWQRTQNGTLSRIEQKVDGLIKWIMATAVTFGLGVVASLVAISLQGR